jgi:hypothetical protein
VLQTVSAMKSIDACTCCVGSVYSSRVSRLQAQLERLQRQVAVLKGQVALEKASQGKEASELTKLRSLLDEVQKRKLAAEASLVKSQRAATSAVAELDKAKHDHAFRVQLLENAAARQGKELQAAQQQMAQRAEHTSALECELPLFTDGLHSQQSPSPPSAGQGAQGHAANAQVVALQKRLDAAYAQVRNGGDHASRWRLVCWIFAYDQLLQIVVGDVLCQPGSCAVLLMHACRLPGFRRRCPLPSSQSTCTSPSESQSTHQRAPRMTQRKFCSAKRRCCAFPLVAARQRLHWTRPVLTPGHTHPGQTRTLRLGICSAAPHKPLERRLWPQTPAACWTAAAQLTTRQMSMLHSQRAGGPM